MINNPHIIGFSRNLTLLTLDTIFKGSLLRAPTTEEIMVFEKKIDSMGVDAAIKELRATAEGKSLLKLSKRQICHRLLNNFTFFQKDMGHLNEIYTTGHFIISGPKCGTTTLYNQIKAKGHKVFAIHNDEWLRKYMPNGALFHAHDVQFQHFITLADKSNNPVIYFGFREPISWYFSLAAELHIPATPDLANSLPTAIKNEQPWKTLGFEKSQAIVESIVGTSITSLPFDKSVGFGHYQLNDFELVLYRIDALDRMINKLGKRFGFERGHHHRVTSNKNHIELATTFSCPRKNLKSLYASELMGYFYDEESIEALLNRYSTR